MPVINISLRLVQIPAGKRKRDNPMKHTLFLVVIMALILVARASAQDLEKAKQEGRLVFYTSECKF